MSTQAARKQNCEELQILSEAPAEKNEQRKIVYLKDHQGQQARVVSCSRITCPGFCTCASK